MPIDPRLLLVGARTAGQERSPFDLAEAPASEPFLDAFTLAHLSGYGSVDAPSPWGHDRDAFDAEHPNYQGGFYNPSSGFYDSPAEVSFQAPGPGGPVTIGQGAETGPSASPPPDPGSAGQSYSTDAPQDNNGTGSQSDNRTDAQDSTTAFDYGSFVEALQALADYQAPASHEGYT